LNVRPDQDNVLTVVCDLIADERGFFDGAYIDLDGFVTDDFNITSGLFYYRDWISRYTCNVKDEDGNALSYPVSIYGKPPSREKIHFRGQLYVIRASPEQIVVGEKQLDYNEAIAEGFYPGPTKMIWHISIADLPSSLLFSQIWQDSVTGVEGAKYSRILITAGAGKFFEDVPFLFYINNTARPIENYLLPIVYGMQIINLNTSETHDFEDTFWLDPVHIETGQMISVSSKLINPYTITLRNLAADVWLDTSIGWLGGWDRAEVPTLCEATDCKGGIYDFEMQPGEEKIISKVVNILDNPNLFHVMAFCSINHTNVDFDNYRPSSYLGSYVSYYAGGDTYPYLMFEDVIPEIILTRNNEGITQPAFFLQVAFHTGENRVCHSNPDAPPECTDGIRVEPGDYSLIVKIEKEDGTQVYEDVIPLDEEHGFSGLRYNERTTYNLTILPDPSIIESGTKFYVNLKLESHRGRFSGMTVAENPTRPYFLPGNFLYLPEGNRFHIYKDSKESCLKISLFNPFASDMELTINQPVMPNNFDVYLKAEDGRIISLPYTVSLPSYEIEQGLQLCVNYTADVSSDFEESFQLEASASSDGETTTETESFVIDVSNSFLNWINLKALNIDARDVLIGTEMQITGYWSVEGSEGGFSAHQGKEYVVRLAIKDGQGTIIQEKISRYTIPQETKSESISITLFSSAPANYTMELEIDLNNNVTEIKASGEAGEDDNTLADYARFIGCVGPERYYRVGECYYNSSERRNYICVITEEFEPDDDCECECEFGFICRDSYCIELGSREECSPLGTWQECLSGEDIVCVWQCSSESCPPGNINRGSCKSCSELPEYSFFCDVYNNNESCVADPCGMANIECSIFGCSAESNYACVWKDNQCVLNYTMPGAESCYYTANVMQECEEGMEFGIVYFNSSDPGCENKARQFACTSMALDFFSWQEFLLASVFLFILYFLISEFLGLKKQKIGCC